MVWGRIIYQGAWVWNLEGIDWSLIKKAHESFLVFFYRVFSVPNKRGHRLFWNLSRPYYRILLKKTIQGNEPTLPPPQQKSLARPVICVLVEQKKPMGKILHDFTTLLKYTQWKGMKRTKTSSLMVPLGIPFQKHQGKNSPVIRTPVGPMGKSS